MSRRLKSLQTVRQLARSAERREAERLAESMRRLDERHQRLNDLQGYLHEYTEDLHAEERRGTTVAALRLRRRFVQQLGTALGQQTGAAEAASRQVVEQRARWFSAKRRLDAIDDLIERQKAREDRVAHKKEQREHDDLAARLWQRRR